MIGFVKEYLYARKVKKLRRLVDLWIAEYRLRLTGENRFLINPQVIATAFPEFNEMVIHDVWLQLVVEKQVDHDPYDYEWCLR